MPDATLRTLTALRGLRRAETDLARRDLGKLVRQETALAARDGEIARELAQARRIPGDFDRQAFAAWFERMRAERTNLHDAMRAAETRTSVARRSLTRHRLAETAAEEALAAALMAHHASLASRDQLMLEDVARALRQAADRDRTHDGIPR